MKKGKYLDLLSNESAKSQGWMYATFMLTGFCIYFGFLLKTTINEMPVRLIPYQYDVNEGIIEVSKNGEANQEYIELITRGDVNLLTEFKPKNVSIKAKQLLNRLEPTLYATNKTKLLDQAKGHADRQITQTYMIETVKARNGNEVLVYGDMKRWEASELVSEGSINFALTYHYIDGIPYIASYKTFQHEKEIVEVLNEQNQ